MSGDCDLLFPPKGNPWIQTIWREICWLNMEKYGKMGASKGKIRGFKYFLSWLRMSFKETKGEF